MNNWSMNKWQPALLALCVSAALIPAQAADKKAAWDVNAPQGKFETVQINTDSGTWMNVDVSPDGKTLVFDVLGDIYTMPVSGGTAKRLTSDIGWQMQPSFSPDGKFITYTSDEGGGDNIWLMNADGSNAHAVTEETFRLLNSPAWSPDGEFIVARKHFTNTRSLGAGEVWMYHKSGGNGVMLTEKANDEKDLGEPAFSPDGKYVYFSQDDTPGKTFHYSKDSEQGIYVIKRFERETGKIEVLLEGAGGAIRPTPSPDGKFLAYIRRVDFQTTLMLYNLESGETTELYGKLDRDMQETWAIHGVYPQMSWTPDNKAIVFWAGGKIQKLDVASKQVAAIPFKVDVEKKIQQAVRVKQNLDHNNIDVKMLRFVQASPDGNTVLYSALGHLYKVAAKGGKPQRLTAQNEHFELYPSFSRDGKKLVYVSWHDQQQGQIKVIDLETNQVSTVVSAPGKYLEPSFSPDGKTLVFRKGGAGSLLDKRWSLNTGIYTVPAAGGELKLVSRNGFAPHYADRNDRIFAMDYGQSPTLLTIDLATETQRTLYSAKYGTEFKVSPDGKYVAFADRFKVYVTPFAERGASIDISGSDTQFPVRQLSVRAGENISWSGNSKQLYWNLGPELYHANLSSVFDVGSDKAADKFKVANGQNISFSSPAYQAEGLVAFVGGQVITMQGDKVIQDGVVLVEGNKIKAVGTVGEVKVPAGAKVIDIKGKTLMPGLFDAHAHGSQGVNQIIPQQNYANYASLALGVTSIHDPSNDTQEIFTASEMQKTGQIVGPRIFSTGTILYGAYGAGYTSHVDSLDDAKFHLERLKKVGAFSVKSYNQPRRNQRQQVIEAARELDMMVVPEGGSLLQHNLSMAVDGHTTLEHSLPAAKLYDDVKQLWRATKTAYTPTLVVAYGGIWGENYWYDKTEVWKHPRLSKYVPMDELRPRSMRRPTAPDSHYNHFSIAKMAKELSDEGVITNIGAHGQRESLGAHWEIWMFAQGGMSPLQALKTATINPAKTFGMDHQLGSVEAGKLADLIVIDGNPLADIRQSDRVQYTMVNGRLFDAESMHELNGQQQQRLPFYFEKH
ncbi:amidohydrolase family protein [Rheinheimera texasensis]|uniref:amidohydrolase family protein n=1 Tax=Rheinheimera texasensis TaxID=306205 RepID=UPI000AED19D3|nr:amidohydrolase family protein [Rheinheimera texasensis]